MKLSLLTLLCFVGAAPPACALRTTKTSMTQKQQEARRKLQEAVAKRNLQEDEMMEFLGEIWGSLPELFGDDFEVEDIFPGFGDTFFEGEPLPSDMPSMMPSDMPSMMPSDMPSDMPSMMPSDTPSMTPGAWEDTGDDITNDFSDPDDEEGGDPDADRDIVFQPEGEEEGGDPDADPDAVLMPDESRQDASSASDGADTKLIIPLTVGLVAGLVAAVLALFVYRGRRRTRAAAAVEAGGNAVEEGYYSSDGDGGGPNEPHTDDDDNDHHEEHVDEEEGAYGPESPRQGSTGNSEMNSAYEMSDIGAVESKSTGRLSPQLSNTVTL